MHSLPGADLPFGMLIWRAGPVSGGRKKTRQHPVPEPFMFIQTTSLGVAGLANDL